MKITLLAVAGLVAAILLVSGGFLLGMDPEVGGVVRERLPEGFYDGSVTVADYELQQEVLEVIESNYYKEIDPASLEGGAIDGMVAGLGDPYTVYYDPEEYAALLEGTSGEYSGVGMVVEMADSLVTIVSVFEDSPAELGGIEPGDIILAVDGISVQGQTLYDVVDKIRGPETTSVTLGMYRPPSPSSTTTTTVAGEDNAEADVQGATADLTQLPPGGEIMEYTLTRKTLPVPVTARETFDVAGQEVAYIAFANFWQKSADELRTQVQEAVNTDHVVAIILDLRGNTGGFIDQAVDVASIFIPQGEKIVSTEGLNDPEKVWYATGNAFTDIRLYVLTDEYTASASEIVSGALQDYQRATLVGETTFGKGLVQPIFPLSNGGALKMTAALYYTPDGRNINGTGITPDVEAPDDPATAEVDETLEEALDLISSTVAAQ